MNRINLANTKSLLCMLLSLAAVALPSDCYAFTAKLHRLFTQMGLEIYKSHCTSNGSRVQPDLEHALIEGTGAEDETQLLSRATNWHFYNRAGKVQDGFWMNRTLDRIFAARVSRLEELMNEEPSDRRAVFRQAGRVLHYLQDMSVPAHVIPIFHGKIFVFGESDEIDEYAPPNHILANISFDEERCTRLRVPRGKGLATLKEYLEDTAQHTLLAIGQGIEPNPSGQWLRFWPDPRYLNDRDPVLPGFGLYGACRFEPSRTGRGECSVDTKTQDQLLQQLYQRVIDDTVRILLYLE